MKKGVFVVKLGYMKKKVVCILGLMMLLVVSGPVSGDVHAKVISESRDGVEKCEKSFFGMRPWYQGLVTVDSAGNCVIGTPKAVASGNSKEKKTALAPFVWTIVLNVLVDLFTVTGLASILFIIIGGYWYLRSGGEPALVARGKKTIQTAAIGTAISLLATVATNLIVTILINS